MMEHEYRTARAFRMALEDRINRQAREQHIDHRRLRNQVAFDRLLARLFEEQQGDPPWVLKGGYAFELRLGGKARATLDLDLSIPTPARIAPPDEQQITEIVDTLQQAANRDLNDWFVFRLSEPIKDLITPPYGGAKLLVHTLLDQRTFAKFHLDIGLGDVMITAPDWLSSSGVLDFAGIPPARVAVLPLAQQFAEKVHAYTMPRGQQVNNRVKDLTDLLLLLEMGLPETSEVIEALQATFARRQTHPLSATLPRPPAAWRAPFATLAHACGLRHRTLEEGFAVLERYWQRLHRMESAPPFEGGER
jgi:hypothetical protein